MKILYLVKRDLDSTAREIMEHHGNSHEVTVIDLRETSDYDRIVEVLEASDRVISW